ncbi:hypothetical protein UFOVP1201_23 [uncultured Caudovirales phage]|uniref:Uncharacterized protein n=1 Tax=uncultured Caudovirales phage TaxID=2100421 RepID=A0A6J5NRZ0_9CAUD|nr:hypothetical protein UFOVP788_16 [uncultured Caudovirales phage]CAB4189898.1 hypothetical protein UFOVP1201_23 [uncultured Caudovirales phage]
MAFPVTVNAYINFSTGASFAQAMILDQGLLDTNILADSVAIIVDVSDVIDSIRTNRGRNAQADQFQTGTLSLRIVDQNGDFNAQNPLSPYAGLITPMRKVQITATYAGITYPVFSGFITSFTTTTPLTANDIVYTTIEAVDAFRLAQNAQISTVAGSGIQLSGARINAILDQIAWPTSMRDVDQGLSYMAADPGGARTALAAMQVIESSEYGALYVSADGSFTFQDRSVTASSVAGTPVIFTDTGAGIGYSNAVWRLDDTLVYNRADITRLGGTVQSTSDTASIDKYFLHSYNQQNLLMQTDAESLQYGQAYVASRAETSIRCDAINLDLYTANYAAGIVAALSLDFFDPVTITTTQPGASTLTKTLQVFGVAMNISPNRWGVTFTTLEPIIDAFILDSALYGLLDTDVLSY